MSTIAVKTNWGLTVPGRPPTPSEGRAQSYARIGPTDTQGLVVFGNGTCLSYGPDDLVDEFLPGIHPFGEQVLLIDKSIRALQSERSRHEGTKVTNQVFDKFRTQLDPKHKANWFSLDGTRYLQVPSKYSHVHKLPSVYGLQNKTDVRVDGPSGESTDTRYGIGQPMPTRKNRPGKNARTKMKSDAAGGQESTPEQGESSTKQGEASSKTQTSLQQTQALQGEEESSEQSHPVSNNPQAGQSRQRPQHRQLHALHTANHHQRANFHRGRFQQAGSHHARAHQARFQQAGPHHAPAQQDQFQHGRRYQSQFQDAQFQQAQFHQVQLQQTQLQQDQLGRALLEQAQLQLAQAQRAQLHQAQSEQRHNAQDLSQGETFQQSRSENNYSQGRSFEEIQHQNEQSQEQSSEHDYLAGLESHQDYSEQSHQHRYSEQSHSSRRDSEQSQYHQEHSQQASEHNYSQATGAHEDHVEQNYSSGRGSEQSHYQQDQPRQARSEHCYSQDAGSYEDYVEQNYLSRRGSEQSHYQEKQALSKPNYPRTSSSLHSYSEQDYSSRRASEQSQYYQAQSQQDSADPEQIQYYQQHQINKAGDRNITPTRPGSYVAPTPWETPTLNSASQVVGRYHHYEQHHPRLSASMSDLTEPSRGR